METRDLRGRMAPDNSGGAYLVVTSVICSFIGCTIISRKIREKTDKGKLSWDYPHRCDIKRHPQSGTRIPQICMD